MIKLISLKDLPDEILALPQSNLEDGGRLFMIKEPIYLFSANEGRVKSYPAEQGYVYLFSDSDVKLDSGGPNVTTLHSFNSTDASDSSFAKRIGFKTNAYFSYNRYASYNNLAPLGHPENMTSEQFSNLWKPWFANASRFWVNMIEINRKIYETPSFLDSIRHEFAKSPYDDAIEFIFNYGNTPKAPYLSPTYVTNVNSSMPKMSKFRGLKTRRSA
jgi:hypothetical protein